MEMANCLRCKKVFPRFKDPICEECKKKDEDLFIKVKEYLEDKPSTPVAEIAAETGASAKKIMGWLREGRLQVAEATGDLKCRKCGVDISSGQYCESCFIEMRRKVEDMMPERPKQAEQADRELPKKGAVMHTKGRR